MYRFNTIGGIPLGSFHKLIVFIQLVFRSGSNLNQANEEVANASY